jgi:hypothetical protein
MKVAMTYSAAGVNGSGRGRRPDTGFFLGLLQRVDQDRGQICGGRFVDQMRDRRLALAW